MQRTLPKRLPQIRRVAIAQGGCSETVRCFTAGHVVSSEQPSRQKAPMAENLGGISLDFDLPAQEEKPSSLFFGGMGLSFTAKLMEGRARKAANPMSTEFIPAIPVEQNGHTPPTQRTNQRRNGNNQRQRPSGHRRQAGQAGPNQAQESRRNEGVESTRNDQFGDAMGAMSSGSGKGDRRQRKYPSSNDANPNKRRRADVAGQQQNTRYNRQKNADKVALEKIKQKTDAQVQKILEAAEAEKKDDEDLEQDGKDQKKPVQMLKQGYTNLLRAFNIADLTARHAQDDTGVSESQLSSLHPEIPINTYSPMRPRGVQSAPTDADSRTMMGNAMLAMSRHKDMQVKQKNDALKVVKKYANVVVAPKNTKPPQKASL